MLGDEGYLRTGHQREETFALISSPERECLNPLCELIEAWRFILLNARLAQSSHAFKRLVEEVTLQAMSHEAFDQLLHLLNSVADAIGLTVVNHLREVSDWVDA
jgi:threonine/homoserine efflux transporter RhtA